MAPQTSGPGGLVVSLPMRDGNSARRPERREVVIVVSLPMRDGNVSGTSREVRDEQVVSLPMRDGNKRPWQGRRWRKSC